MESAQYLYMDISSMNNFFNWTMTYRTDSDVYRPYGWLAEAESGVGQAAARLPSLDPLCECLPGAGN